MVLVPETDFATIVSKDLDAQTIIRKVVLEADTVDAPVTKGQVYGKVELYVNVDQKLGEVNLVASESLERSDPAGVVAGSAEFPALPLVLGWASFCWRCCSSAISFSTSCTTAAGRKKKMKRVNKKFK